MLCGLLITVFWLPRMEHNADGKVKSLEEWQVGREANGFSKEWSAKVIANLYHWVINTWKKTFGGLEDVEMEEMEETPEGGRC